MIGKLRDLCLAFLFWQFHSHLTSAPQHGDDRLDEAAHFISRGLPFHRRFDAITGELNIRRLANFGTRNVDVNGYLGDSALLQLRRKT
jgi:hypothetical protein